MMTARTKTDAGTSSLPQLAAAMICSSRAVRLVFGERTWAFSKLAAESKRTQASVIFSFGSMRDSFCRALFENLVGQHADEHDRAHDSEVERAGNA